MNTEFKEAHLPFALTILFSLTWLILILGCGSKRKEGVSLDGDTITSSFSVDDRGMLDGKSIEYYPSGKKKEEAEYNHGLRDGLYIQYHENGQRFVMAEFDNERLMNVLECKDSSGKSLPFGTFTNGNGTAIIYHGGGRIVETGALSGGYRQGKWVTKASNGDSFIQNYTNGIPEGGHRVSLIVW